MRLIVKATAALAAVLLLVGCSGGGTPTGAPSASTPASSSPSPAGSPSPSPASPSASASSSPSAQSSAGTAPGDDWVETAQLDGVQLSAVTAGGPGVLIGGCVVESRDFGCSEAAIWTSTDGRTLEPATLERPENGSVHRIVAVPGGFMALGSELVPVAANPGEAHLRAIIWRSADGSAWRRIDDQTFVDRGISDVMSTGDALLAFGNWAPYGSEYHGLVLWISPDGDRWRQITSEAPSGIELVEGVLVTPDGLMAWGPRNNYMVGAEMATIARSTDGATWTRVPDQRSLAASEVLGIVELGGRYAAVGVAALPGGDTMAPLAWISDDGREWVRQPPPSGPTSGSMRRLTKSAHGLVASGYARSTPDADLTWTYWGSADGSTWDVLAPGAYVPDVPEMYFADPAPLGSGRVAVGFDGNAGASRVWVSPTEGP